MRRFIHLIISAAVLILAAVGGAGGQPAAADACEDVRYLMARDITPYDLGSDGRVMTSGLTISPRMNAGVYSHFYAINVTANASPFSVAFGGVEPGLMLEYALFKGMEPVTDGYQPVRGGVDFTRDQVAAGAYTLVVRRASLAAIDSEGTYSLRAVFSGSPEVGTNVRDESRQSLFTPAPQVIDGVLNLEYPSARVRLHLDAARAVATQGGRAAQVFFNGGAFLVGAWADDVALLGGDLAVRAADGSRLMYVEDYAYRVDALSAPLTALPAPNGINVTWDIVKGVWITRDCAGFKLADGRTFVTPQPPTDGGIAFTGTLDDFTIRLGRAVSVAMNWYGISEGTELRYADGTLTTALLGGREIALTGSALTLRRRGPPDAVTPNTPLDASADGVQMTLDWVNMERFAFSPERLVMAFNDAPRGTVQRSAAGLLQVEALDDVMRLVYASEERLLLPASDGYLELVSPNSVPTFDSLALPSQAGYLPRGLNNLGAECYTVNTLLAEANCPPNGHPNPANGNLWYSVTDLYAHAEGLPLALTRSYNSSSARTVQGAFGYGWSTAFQLDYNARFDPQTGARTVSASSSYRTGLDLTYAPRGLVRFTTPSGSQHLFTSGDNLTFTTATMPGWSLRRDSLRSPWTLTQASGLTYSFDRAGRLVSYGTGDRTVRISYPRAALNGPADAGRAVITDAADQRQLELYYDAQHRIARSVLRDLTRSADGDACEAASGCYTTTYTYDERGMLVTVDYADGQQARYTYDDNRRLTSHIDPRAPIAERMAYSYTSTGVQRIEWLAADGTPTVWRALADPQVTANARAVAVTDEWGVTRTHTYTLEANRSASDAPNAYTLQAVTSPLADLGTIDALPATYTWENGLLTQINARVQQGIGRNSTAITYRPDGRIRTISGAYLGMDVSYDAQGRPVTARSADGTGYTYAYENDRLSALTDPHGANYRFEWSGSQLIRRIRTNDDADWRYVYNALDLPITVTQGRYEITYRWDGLGRVTRMRDSLGETFDIAYGLPHSGDITITDSIGAVTRLRFSPRGQLIEWTLEDRGGVLRRETYAYDALGRMRAHSVYADAVTPLTTTYTYEARLLLPSQPGDTVQRPVINGYALRITDPYGRAETFSYDGYGRLRQVEDAFGQITRYDYFYRDTLTNGLRVVQRDFRGAALVTTVTYLFDLNWQLRSVSQQDADQAPDAPPRTWEFSSLGDPVRLSVMESRLTGLRTVDWDNYSGTNAGRVIVGPETSALDRPDSRPVMAFSRVLDFAGPPTRIASGGGEYQLLAYCPLLNGGQQTLVSVVNAPNGFGCASPDFAQRLTHDAHGRLAQVEDGLGTRTYTYSTDADTQEYRVSVDFSGGFTWALAYNAAGDLIRWTDDAGFTRTYVHDMAGRMVSVTVDGEPEASYTFEYNALGQVTRQVDGLGRGTIYQFDARGLLTLQQDALTSDAFTFAYSSFGDLTTIISPLGNTITLLYQDAGDPRRLTGIIDSSGVEERFIWDDDNNVLIYRDSRGLETRYWFDAFNQLWRIDDAAGTTHTLRYDGAGNLQRWATGTARSFSVTPNASGTLTLSEASQPNWRWDLAFNPAGGVAALVTPGGAALNLNYDALGRFAGTDNYPVTREPGAPVMTVNGARMAFDPLFRLREAVSADGGVTTYDYATGRRSDVTLTVTNDAERVYTFSPGDGSTRRRSVTLAADGRTLSYFYNAEGLIDEIRFDLCLAEDGEECGSTNTWTGAARIVYDAQGRPSRIIDEEQNIEIFSYDDVGNLLTYQSANGRTFTYQYDTLNRLTGVTGVTGISYLLRYDPLGNLAGLCRIRAEFASSYETCRQAGGELAVYSYDALGRLVQQRYPSSGAPDGEAVINYTYNGGLLTQWGQGESLVTLDYTADALALLKAVSYSGGSVVFDYDADYRLLRTSEGTGYSYDPLGRLSAVRALGRSLAIDYAPDRQGYTATDEASGASITVALDERGLLRALEYAAMLGQPAAGDAQADFRYVIDPRNTALLGSVMTSGDEQRLIDQQVNRTNQTQNLVLNYGDDRLLLDYVNNPAGRVNRQRVDGSPETFFVQETQGYIQVVGYNDDDRASTVRVNAKNDGALLYVANFTYNDSGLRATETRRFSDSTQMTIQYEYGSRQQLTRRLVTMRWERRQETFEYLYSYDAAGNLLRIETIRANRPQGDNLETCATFTYDSLNRLTGAQIDGRRYLYGYDIYNRLIRANNLSLVYAGDTPLVAVNPLGLTTVYAGLDDRPLLFFGEAGRAVWLVPDGRDSALGIAGSDDALTLLDPLGRPILLEAPPSPDAIRPCSLTPVSSDLTDLAYPQPGLAGMLWHPPANLYFHPNGRVYQPEIGQFLQRDPAGARLNMGPYEFSRREPAPVQLRSGPAFMTGLRKLNSALAYSGLAQDADAVRAAHYPSLDGATLWTSPLSTRSPLSPALERLLSLPGWLRSGYNLPGAQVDALTGRLTLRADSAPAQHIRPFEAQLPAAVTWLPEGVAPVSARVQRLMGALNPAAAPVDDYRSLAWANPGGTLQALWTPQIPARPGNVSAVLAWLPNGLTAPQDARAMLDLMAGMLKLPRMTGMDWLDSLLATALPSLPDTPPQTAAALRARYFADDLPSALALPAYRLPLPEAPTLPQYGIGHDDRWLFP